MSLGDILLGAVIYIFQPIVVDATIFIVCFNVVLQVIDLLQRLTNPKQRGGEM